MIDTTVKKVDASHSPTGERARSCLVSGRSVALRRWENLDPGSELAARRRSYETVGYVLGGRAELMVEYQRVILEPGDSWLIPANAKHSYRIHESFTAIEATSPPARVQGRDDP